MEGSAVALTNQGRQAVETDDVAVADEILSARFPGYALLGRPRRAPFRFSLRCSDVGRLRSDLLRHSTAVRVRIDPPRDHMLGLITGGSATVRRGHEEVGLRPGDTYLLATDEAPSIRWPAIERHVLHLSTDAVTAAARALGAEVDEVRFSDVVPVSSEAQQSWRRLLRFVLGELTSESTLLAQPLVQAQVESLLATGMLATFGNVTMADPVRRRETARPASLRRAVDFIVANAEQPLKLDQIALAAGCGSRALHYTFRTHYETSPLGYLRQVRLRRAREDLEAADSARGDSVADIAHRWGFVRVDRFAAAYAQAFGVSARETLRRQS